MELSDISSRNPNGSPGKIMSLVAQEFLPAMDTPTMSFSSRQLELRRRLSNEMRPVATVTDRSWHPTHERLDRLVVGDSVKLIVHDHRFWAIIHSVSADKLVGSVDSLHVPWMIYGQDVEFTRRHVIEIYDPMAPPTTADPEC